MWYGPAFDAVAEGRMVDIYTGEHVRREKER